MNVTSSALIKFFFDEVENRPHYYKCKNEKCSNAKPLNRSFWDLKTVVSAVKKNDETSIPVEPATIDRDYDEFYF
jgi:hypothetical protein